MSYQRNQVVWTVARSLVRDPAPAFEHDVAQKLQRLIDRDRALPLGNDSQQYAFLGDDLPGKGTLVLFSEETAFLLLLGLLLLESGLTQSRVVRLTRDLRSDLHSHYHWITSYPPASFKGQRSDEQWQENVDQGRYAIEPAQFSYLVASGNLADRDGEVDHRLCRSQSELQAAIIALSPDPRPLIVVELTNRALQTFVLLSEAPIITRGRRPKA